MRDRFYRSHFSLSGLIDCACSTIRDEKAHPERFSRSGIVCFCGPQGSGKTLSAVDYVQRLASVYPDCLICSNISLSGLSQPVVEYDGISSLTDLNNGELGVIYLIDEIHLEFNSLESKSIPLEVFTEISQQRKQRKHIVATSQLFLRLAKPFREQARYVVLCETVGRFLQHNVVLDGATLSEDSGGVTGRRVASYWFNHSRALYDSYDTFAKIDRRYSDVWKTSLGASALPYADLFASGSRPGGGK